MDNRQYQTVIPERQEINEVILKTVQVLNLKALSSLWHEKGDSKKSKIGPFIEETENRIGESEYWRKNYAEKSSR